MSKFAKECLEAHNSYRKKHGVGKLEMDSELCRIAQSWADHLSYDGNLAHSSNTHKGDKLGENVAMKWSSGGTTDYTGEEVTKQWYSEVEKYPDYKVKTPTTMDAGHFTQVVWKGTKKFGIGKAEKNGKCFVVANYQPGGNYRGQFADNVLPPSEGKSLFSFGKKKKDKDSSSESDDDRKGAKGYAVYKDDGGQVRKVTTTTKRIITKRVTKPDGTVVETQEEIIEEGPGTEASLAQLKLDSHSKKSSSNQKGKTKKKSMDKFIDEVVDAHNSYRKKHKSPSIKHSKNLSAYAQKWADHLVASGSLSHSSCTMDGKRLGENIAYKWSSDPSADYAGGEFVKQWYDEEPQYDYSGKSNMGSAGHFTQVVWKESTEVGVGKASDSSGKTYVVASYYPTGNMMGQFKENVSKP